MRVTISLYANPYQYPPTLHAMECLQEMGEEVTLIGLGGEGTKSSDYLDIHSNLIRWEEKRGLNRFWRFVKRAQLFFTFLIALKKSSNDSDLVLCYDNVALLATCVALVPKKKISVWYHSHDYIHIKNPFKISLLTLSKRLEPFCFNRVDYFSLPVRERLSYYKVPHRLIPRTFIVPNYPLIEGIHKAFSNQLVGNVVKILYQGNINDSHGFENIIPLLPREVEGRRLHLTLIGPIKSGYKKKLESVAKSHHSIDCFKILPPVHYDELASITKNYHIGLATHLPGEKLIYTFGATASNKIYEYAVAGLPVLLYDTEHYRSYLGHRIWANFTDLSHLSLLSSIAKIISNYEVQSFAARNDVFNDLNFSNYFKQVYLNEIKKSIKE